MLIGRTASHPLVDRITTTATKDLGDHVGPDAREVRVGKSNFRTRFSRRAKDVCDLGCNSGAVVTTKGKPGLSTLHTFAGGSG